MPVAFWLLRFAIRLLGLVAPELVRASCPVVTFDTPAHGRSPGRTTGLGQHRTLRDPEVIVRVVAFITSQRLGISHHFRLQASESAAVAKSR